MADPAAQAIDQAYTAEKVAHERKRIEDMITGIKQPGFDFSKITPEDYQLLEKYVPQIAQYVVEKNPTLITASAEGAKAGRAAQMDALSKYRQLAQSGEDVNSRIMEQQALMNSARQNRGQQESILDQARRTGTAGGGNTLVAQLLAQQGSAQGAQQAAQQQAMAAYQRRLDAMKSGAGLGSDIYTQDVNLERTNADILNSYNQRLAANQNAYNQYAANQANDASKYNIKSAQDIANANVENRNKASQNYQDNYNKLQQQKYQDAYQQMMDRVKNEQDKAKDEMMKSQERQSTANSYDQKFADLGKSFGWMA